MQAISLGFLAGYVDTLGFVALFGLFTAHVTGNFVLIGAALANATHASIALKLLAFPAFIVGVAATRLLSVAVERRGGLALLLGFMVFGAAAMGAHSAISRLLLAHLAPTSMMTGNVTQLVIDTLDVLRGAADGATRERCVNSFWPLLGFAVGAILAAFAYLAVPLAILLVLIALEPARLPA